MKGRKGAIEAFRLPLLANTENRDRLRKNITRECKDRVNTKGKENIQGDGEQRQSPFDKTRSTYRRVLVRAVGLEPTRAYALQILSLICLPFHHARI